MSERLLERVQIGKIRKINWGNLKQRISIEGLASFYEYYLKPITFPPEQAVAYSGLIYEHKKYPEIFARTKKSYTYVNIMKHFQVCGRTNKPIF